MAQQKGQVEMILAPAARAINSRSAAAEAPRSRSPILTARIAESFDPKQAAALGGYLRRESTRDSCSKCRSPETEENCRGLARGQFGEVRGRFPRDLFNLVMLEGLM